MCIKVVGICGSDVYYFKVKNGFFYLEVVIFCGLFNSMDWCCKFSEIWMVILWGFCGISIWK